MTKEEEIELLQKYTAALNEKNALMEMLNAACIECLETRLFSIKGVLVRKFFGKYMTQYFKIIGVNEE
jgi:hypothetical protein